MLQSLRRIALSIIFALGGAANADVVTTTVTFDGFSGGSLIVNGYRFDGVLSLDNNFASSPALRIYGNVPLTISRIDGEAFSLESLMVLYQSSPAFLWQISNDRGSGQQLSWSWNNALGSSFNNIQSVRIFDPIWNGTSYFVFDNFVLSHIETPLVSATVPEPASALLFGAGLGLMYMTRRKKLAC